MKSEKIAPAYLAPEVELVVVHVEAGFAFSIEDMEDGKEQNPWD